MTKDLEKKVVFPPKGKYVLAVSGGVDSITLLNTLVAEKKYELIVAHFDHGIRHNSKEDCEFVAKLADKHKLKFEHAEGRLGKNTTEEHARNARYNFFNFVAKKHGTDFVITAQHLDDAIETLIFNVIRGTDMVGLAPFTTNAKVLRPLRYIYKQEIITYARQHKLGWHEDETNQDLSITRNYIRHVLIPLAEKEYSGSKQKLAEIIRVASTKNTKNAEKVDQLYSRLAKASKKKVVYKRSELLLLTQKELLSLVALTLQKLLPGTFIDTKTLKSVELFAKTASKDQQYEISKKLRAISGRGTLSITLSETV